MSDPPALPCILVVDDDEASRHLVELALRDLAVEVLTCGEPSAVLNLVIEKRPAAVVLDVMMPGLDGPTIVTQIRSAGLDVVPKMVLWSAMGASELQEKARQCGADAIVMKVAGPSVLARQLATWLDL